jgi:hypothetical protein
VNRGFVTLMHGTGVDAFDVAYSRGANALVTISEAPEKAELIYFP